MSLEQAISEGECPEPTTLIFLFPSAAARRVISCSCTSDRGW